MEKKGNISKYEVEEEIFEKLEKEGNYEIKMEDIPLGTEVKMDEVFSELSEEEENEDCLYKKGKEQGMKIMLENIIDIMYKKGYSDARQEFGL